MAERQYTLGHSQQETERLTLQAQRLQLPLLRLFEDAGIEPGMRVLDLGSGAGDVALAAARVVGEGGSVVGVDRNPAILETAQERVRAAGCHNITFVTADLDQDFALDGEFDALVGRLVLMYVADPVATLRRALHFIRPGGIVAFNEFSFLQPSSQDMAYPPSPLMDRIRAWTRQAFEATGNETAMGWKLYQTFLDAGLPGPTMRGHFDVASASHPTAFQEIAGMMRSRRPVLLQHGLATEEELRDPDAIVEQLRQEFIAERKIGRGVAGFDAWARKP